MHETITGKSQSQILIYFPARPQPNNSRHTKLALSLLFAAMGALVAFIYIFGGFDSGVNRDYCVLRVTLTLLQT